MSSFQTDLWARKHETPTAESRRKERSMKLSTIITRTQAQLEALTALQAATETLEAMGFRVEVFEVEEGIAPAPKQAKPEPVPERSDGISEKPARAQPLRSPARTLQRSKFKPGPKWTPEEDERAIEMTARGFTIAEVAAKLGRPEHGTRKRLLKFSAEVKSRAGKFLAAREAPEPPCNGFTPEMDARLSRYMADGLGIGGAASMLNVQRDKVQARWDALAEAQQEAAE